MIDNCPLKSNCKSSFDCSWCVNFSSYNPVDKRVLSPPQMEHKKQKKVKKQTAAAKRGRANKNTGRQSEQKLVKLLTSNGIEAERIPLSGSLGGKYSNDVHFTVNGHKFTVENKRRQQFNRIRKLTEDTTVYVSGLGYLMNQRVFLGLIKGYAVPEVIEKENKGFKTLQKWFLQDGADIVSMDERHKEFLFCVSSVGYERILKIIKEENNG